MKAKNILLSTIILGGFFTPVITSTVAQAATLKTEVKPTVSKENQATTNDQEARDKKIQLNEKFDLNDLDEKTTIVIPAKTVDGKQNLDNIYLNLDAKDIAEIKANQKITIASPTLKTHSNWGGKLNYKNSEENITLTFDETKGLSLDQGDHLKLILESGDSL